MKDLYIEEHLTAEEMLERFDEAGLEPPKEWLLEWAETFWGMKWREPDSIEAAILYFERGGAVERLNHIGEFLFMDMNSRSIEAFLAAGNATRAREVGEAFLRAGRVIGLRAFKGLQEKPSRALLRDFAAAAFAAQKIVLQVLDVLSEAGVVLPIAQLRDAAKEYDSAGDWHEAKVLRARIRTRMRRARSKKGSGGAVQT